MSEKTSWKTAFYGALADLVRRNSLKSVDFVTGFEERTESGGYCGTCWYEEILVTIDFIDGDGEEDSYTYYGDMANLVRDLTDE